MDGSFSKNIRLSSEDFPDVRVLFVCIEPDNKLGDLGKFSLTILTMLGAISSPWIKQIFNIIYHGRPSEAGDTDTSLINIEHLSIFSEKWKKVSPDRNI